MLSRFHGILVLCIVTVTRASFLSVGRWSRIECTLNGVGVFLALPEVTRQWSLVGLNLWPSQAVDKDASSDSTRFARVLNFFPVPVEEECLSEDKRRQGICMNTYECRIKHGVSHGPCALGFGVCCIFTVSCDNEVQNNLTYVTSPGFPNLIDRPMNCSVVVRKIDTEVSQLRIDFIHFNIGQPNAMTGVCDQDVMEISNGRTSFELCGWNSGQHVYVDVDGRDNETITLNFRLSDELQSRMWEMRVAQLGFEQRAPAGCLQYFLSPNGTLRTFNYLPNGRYLAGHDYLLCVRQERDMCGIAYRPCTRDSFRIGPGPPPAATSNATSVVTPMSQTPQTPQTVAAANAATVSAVEPPTSVAPAPSMSPAPPPTSVDEADAADVVEGSGAAAEREMREWFNPGGATLPSPYERRCGDRVLIPCDFEEFITPGNNMAGICNLEHCGSSLCGQNELDANGDCRVETWTTPFRIRVAFGFGSDAGGTLEDNTGMCLTYQQMPCVA